VINNYKILHLYYCIIIMYMTCIIIIILFFFRFLIPCGYQRVSAMSDEACSHKTRAPAG